MAKKKAKEEAERLKEKSLQQTEQIAQWVEAKGTDNQKERLTAGVLPQDEIIELIKAEFFQLAELPIHLGLNEYQPLTAGDTPCHCDSRYCELEFDVLNNVSCSAEAWELKKKLEELYPEAVVDIRKHTGQRKDCSGLVVREGVRIKQKVGIFEFVKEFGV